MFQLSVLRCCRAALAEVNYSFLCDLIETEEKGEKEEEEKGREHVVFLLIHSDGGAGGFSFLCGLWDLLQLCGCPS